MAASALFCTRVLSGSLYSPLLLADMPVRIPLNFRSNAPLYQANIRSILEDRVPVNRFIKIVNLITNRSELSIDFFDRGYKYKSKSFIQYTNLQ